MSACASQRVARQSGVSDLMFNDHQPRRRLAAQRWDFGASVAGYAWRGENPRARMLLQHGFAEYAERHQVLYSGFIDQIVAAGIDVFAFDLMGHGRSPGKRGHVDIESAVAMHIAARQALEPDALPLFLFGHSLGGLITANSCSIRPKRVDGVVLSSPAFWLSTSATTEIILRLGSALLPTAPAARQGDPSSLTRKTDMLSQTLADPHMFRGPLTMRLAKSALTATRAVWASRSRWTAPTLAVHGASDVATSPANTKLFVDGIASSDKSLIIVPNGLHELLNDFGSEELLDQIVGWLIGRLTNGGEASPPPLFRTD